MSFIVSNIFILNFLYSWFVLFTSILFSSLFLLFGNFIIISQLFTFQSLWSFSFMTYFSHFTLPPLFSVFFGNGTNSPIFVIWPHFYRCISMTTQPLTPPLFLSLSTFLMLFFRDYALSVKSGYFKRKMWFVLYLNWRLHVNNLLLHSFFSVSVRYIFENNRNVTFYAYSAMFCIFVCTKTGIEILDINLSSSIQNKWLSWE